MSMNRKYDNHEARYLIDEVSPLDL